MADAATDRTAAETAINVRVERHGETTQCMHFETKDARYHVWLDRDLRPIKKSDGSVNLFKNPHAERGQPGYFNTRVLRGDRGSWAQLIADLLAHFDVAETQARFAAERQAEAERLARANAEAERQERIRDAAPALLAALRVALNEVHHPGACQHERGQDIAEFLEAAMGQAECGSARELADRNKSMAYDAAETERLRCWLSEGLSVTSLDDKPPEPCLEPPCTRPANCRNLGSCSIRYLER